MLVFLMLAEFLYNVVQKGSSFVVGASSRASRKRTTCRAETGEMNFELEPVLQAAHKEWGRCFEKHDVQRLGSKYRPVLGTQRWDFDIDMGKKGHVDFLGLGNGIEAWQAFAQDYKAYMRNATYTKLQKPHFLIAEIGLTTQTLKKKFDDNATLLMLLQSFVSSVESSNLSAVKCLVYDGADA